MSILVIGQEEEKAIAEALERARANPMPWKEGQNIGILDKGQDLTFNGRPPRTDEIREKYPSQHLMLGTYRIAFSFEEQPAGLFKHLSVSSNNKKKVPGLEVMQMVAEAFGFSGIQPGEARRAWMEEFEPGWYAVNIIEMVQE